MQGSIFIPPHLKTLLQDSQSSFGNNLNKELNIDQQKQFGKFFTFYKFLDFLVRCARVAFVHEKPFK